MRFAQLVIGAVLVELVGSGCATPKPPERRLNALSVTNVVPGNTYDLTVYTVAHGDTLVRIAKRFGITVKDIFELNPQLDITRLEVGEVILVRQQTRGGNGG